MSVLKCKKIYSRRDKFVVVSKNISQANSISKNFNQARSNDTQDTQALSWIGNKAETLDRYIVETIPPSLILLKFLLVLMLLLFETGTSMESYLF